MTNIRSDILCRFQAWKDIRIRAGWHLQSHVAGHSLRVVDPQGHVRLTAGEARPCHALFAGMAPAWGSDHVVVMLHSLAGSPAQLRTLEQRLNAEGYPTANVAYPNLFAGMPDHVRQLRGLLEGMAEDGVTRVSFVGHSYGGLLTRALWREDLPVARGPVVFFGTPNTGSHLSAMLRHVPGYSAYFGIAGHDVQEGAVLPLPVPDTPMLVVAGGLGRLGFNPLLGEDNDGIVAVSETRIPGAKQDFVYVKGCLHRYLPRSRKGMKAALGHLGRTLE